MSAAERLLLFVCTISGREARALMLAVVAGALLGVLVGQALPPVYRARVALAAPGVGDLAGYAAVQEALDRLALSDGLRVNTDGNAVHATSAIEVVASDPEAAVRQARAEADRAVALFPAAFRRTSYGQSWAEREVRLVARGTTEVQALDRTGPATVWGGGLGLLLGAALLARRSSVPAVVVP